MLLGTVAIEPNRWGTVHADRRPTIRLGEWLDPIRAAGFDGLEVWEGHLRGVEPSEADAILRHELPVRVFNSYVSLDDPDDAARVEVADWARRTGATGVKCNVGNDSAAEADYAERLASWLADLPETASLLCECHQGISIAEDPAVARRIFERVGDVRMQAIVHTHDDADLLWAKFDAFGDRIRHVHVNLLDFSAMTHPRLVDVDAELRSTVELLRQLGFRGSWTVEFVAGLLGEDDRPDRLVAQAAEDLGVLRSVLA